MNMTDPHFPQIADFASRTWEFNTVEDVDCWNAAGSSCLFPLVSDALQSGQMKFRLPATSGAGFTAFATPATVILGRGTWVRLSFYMNLSVVPDCDFAIGLIAQEHGFLSGSNYLKNGVMLRKDTGTNRMDLVVASGNTSTSYDSSVGSETNEVRLIGAGWALWTFDISTDANILGKGTVKLLINGRLYHSAEFLRLPYGVALTPGFGVFNGAAVTRDLAFDHIKLEHGRYTTTSLTAALTGAQGGDAGGGGGGNGGGGGGNGVCVAEGTLVRMADGTDQAVESLEPGQMLQGTEGPVELLAWRDVFADLGLMRCLEVRSFTGNTVVCTPDHPFMVGPEQVKACDLVDLMQLETTEGLSGVASVSDAGQRKVYALTVEGGVFFAGGVLTHNKDNGWGPASMTTPAGPMPA